MPAFHTCNFEFVASIPEPMKILSKALLIILLTLPFKSHPQLPAIFGHDDKTFQEAWELFMKEKYSAASAAFSAYLEQDKGQATYRISAAYYKAICAYELFHPDAEAQLVAFTQKYPESTKAPLAWFHLARHYYRNKKYQQALPAFEKADVYYLSGQEVTEYYFKTGYCHFHKNQYDQAARNFHEILNVKSKYQTAAQYYYGHIAYSGNNYKTAIDYFNRLDTSATFGPLVPYYISQIYFDQGKYKEAIEYAGPKLKEKNPQNSNEIRRIIAESYYRTGDYKNALAYFDEYAQNTPSLARDDHYTMGFCHYRNQNYKQAIGSFEKVIGPKDSIEQNAWYHLGDCYLKTDNKPSARNAFQFASKMDNNRELQEIATFNYAKLSFELNLPGGLTAFREFLDRYPASPMADEANEMLANLYLSTRNYKDALASLENVKNKTTRTSEAYQKVAYYRGIELMNDRQNDKAINMFEKAILNDVDPKLRAQAMYWKAEILYKDEKYDSAIKQYRTFLFNPGSVNTSMFNLANYNIGYCYFKLNNFNESQQWFRKYLAKKNLNEIPMYDDALMRTGDCLYALRNFDDALRYYNDAIGNKANSSDYAYFQKGMILGLQGDLNAKNQVLASMLSAYPKSGYKSDALYEKGRAQMTLGENNTARESFTTLIRENPGSPYAKKAALSIGLIHYNEQQDELALDQFKKVIRTYPGTPEATEALAAIRNIYVSNGKPEEYFAYVKEIPNVNVSTGAQDSITYEAAEQRYLKSDFSNAARDFEKYLSQFPDGSYRLNATFYKAECDYRNKDYASAVGGYEKIIEGGNNIYLEKSLLRAAEINFRGTDTLKAIGQYKKLEEMAALRDNVITSQAQLMRAYYRTSAHENAIDYAKKLLNGDKISNELKTEAHLYHARSAMALNDLTIAKREFNAVASQTSEAGAESKYNLALIEFRLGNYKSTQSKCYEVANQVPSYDFWIGKSFLLLADNFLALNDVFQAKATLQSLIDNYEKDPADPEDIKTMATEKLDLIRLQHPDESPAKENSPETDNSNNE